MSPASEILTERLRLIPITPEFVRAFYRNKDELSRLLGAGVPANWPVDPVILEILKDQLDNPSAFIWSDYIYIHRQDKKVIGDGGFKGPPDAGGLVEIGYAVLPEYRGMGLATEAARALLERAFSHSKVKSVCAETTVNGRASMAVLQKAGMQRCGARHDEEDGDLYCWRILREEFEKIPTSRVEF